MCDLIQAGLRPENLCFAAVYIVRLMLCSCLALVMLCFPFEDDFSCQALVWLIPVLDRLLSGPCYVRYRCVWFCLCLAAVTLMSG